MSPAIAAGFAALVVGAALFLAQLWFEPFEQYTFFKLIVTDGVVLAIVVIGGFVLRERRASQRMRDRNELD